MTDLRITLPTPPGSPAPWRFPVVAVAAPVVVAVVLWFVTGSLFSLVFAALGPVTALASVADQAWGGRRTSRREAAAFASALAAASRELERCHERERAALEDATPDGPGILKRRHDRGRWQDSDSPRVVLGTARITSRVEVAGHTAPDSPTDLLELAEHARALDGPLVADAGWGIGVVGPLPLAIACARHRPATRTLPAAGPVLVLRELGRGGQGGGGGVADVVAPPCADPGP